jgi:hypothetical protein
MMHWSQPPSSQSMAHAVVSPDPLPSGDPLASGETAEPAASMNDGWIPDASVTSPEGLDGPLPAPADVSKVHEAKASSAAVKTILMQRHASTRTNGKVRNHGAGCSAKLSRALGPVSDADLGGTERPRHTDWCRREVGGLQRITAKYASTEPVRY